MTNIKMQNITVQINNENVPGLIIEKNEWNRLKKMTTDENYDDEANRKQKELFAKATKRNEIRYLQQLDIVAAKEKKFLDDIEAEHQIRDKIRNQEVLENRNKVIENMQLNIWSSKDSTKMIRSEEKKMQVLKERNLQMEFNKAERMKTQEEECLLKIEQNAEAERYRKDQLEQKRKQAEIKKTNNAILLNELKIREDFRRNEAFKLKNEGIAEVQRIKQEIENDKKEKETKIQAKKKIMEHYLNENRKLVAMKNKMRQSEEQKLNMSVAITNETKKRLNKLTKLKEIKMRDERQQLFEKLTEEVKKNLKGMSEKLKIIDQNVNEENERKYQEKTLKKYDLAKKSKKILEDNKKMFEEENQKEKERSKLNRQWEIERLQREKKILYELELLRKQAKINANDNYRKILNDQCATKKAIILANQQAERKDYDALVKLWHQDEADFMNYCKSIMEKYAKDGVTIKPLLKAIRMNGYRL